MNQINKYQYELDGVIYDSRVEEDFLNYIYPNLNKLYRSDDILESKEVVYLTDAKGWDVPLNTEYMTNKKMDYETLGLMTLFSNYRGEKVCESKGIDPTEIDKHRYLYEKGGNSLYSNLQEMERLSQNKRRNIKRDIKKLIECDNKVVEICKDKENRIYYKIDPFATKEYGRRGHFVTINSRMLEYLIHTGNSNVIKTYCAIKVLLWDNKEKCYYNRPITRDFLLKFIGLSTHEKNLQQMSDILKSLVANGYIKRERVIERVEINGEIKTKDTYVYEIMTFQEWLGVYKKL